MEARRSQSTTSRRRRLLTSQETNDLLAEFEALTPQTPAAEPLTVTITAPDRHILQRMISGQLWKHAALIAAIVSLAALAIWSENWNLPALQHLAATNQPRISRGLAGAYLVLCGQLCLMIGWIRSRSVVDYSGRYRCWKWLAALLVASGMLWITNVQDSLPQVAQLFAEPVIGLVGAARRTVVVVPLAGLSLWILSRVVPDMGRNRWSQVAFSIGVAAAATRLVLSYSPDFAAATAAAVDGLLLSASVLMLCSLLLHARFVLYISKDPPERSVSSRRHRQQTNRAEQSAQDSPEDNKRDAAAPRPKKKESAAEPLKPAEPDARAVISVDEVPKEKSTTSVESKGRKRRSKRRGRKAA